MLGQIEAAFSLWDRFTKNNDPDVEMEDEDSVAGRFIQLFEKHGIHRNQIPRYFDHGLTLNDVANNENLIQKLIPETLEAASDFFGTRIDWLEGKDKQIYPTHNFYKHPEEFTKYLKKLRKRAKKKDHQLIPRLYITSNTSKDYDALIVIEEHMYSVSDTAIRYHICSGWVHRNWKARGDLTACIASSLKHVGFMHGKKTNVAIEDFCDGKRFIEDFDELPMVFERVRPFSKVRTFWKPEQWVFDPASYIVDLEERRFGEANALAHWLHYFDQGMMETKYFGENSEPEFRIFFEDYKSESDKKVATKDLSKKGLFGDVTWTKLFSVASGFTVVLAFLAFLFGITSISDAKKIYDKHFVKKEMRVISMNSKTFDNEDKKLELIPDNKKLGCTTTKTNENNKLVLIVRCKGFKGDTIDYTVTSKSCPNSTGYTDFGKLGGDAVFEFECD